MRNYGFFFAASLAVVLSTDQSQADWLQDMSDSVKEGLSEAGDKIDGAIGQPPSDRDKEKPSGGATDLKTGGSDRKDNASDSGSRRIEDPTDPKLERVQDVRPVDRVAHSTVDGLRVRTLPGTDTAVAGSIGEDEVVRVTGEVPGTYSGYRWVRVQFADGSFAYAAREFMENGRPEPTRAAEATSDTGNGSGSGKVEKAESGKAGEAGSGESVSSSSGSTREKAKTRSTDAERKSAEQEAKSDGGAREAGKTPNAGGKAADGPPPIDYSGLLDAYIDANGVADTRDFRDAYARRYLCDALDRVREDEFLSRDLVLTKAGEWAKERASDNRTFRMRVGSIGFGQYQPAEKAFPIVYQGRGDFDGMPEELPFALTGEDDYCDYGTKVAYTVPDPENPVWPNRFRLTVSGFDALDWLKMPVDEARKLVQERKSEVGGDVDRSAILDFEIEVSDGPAKPRKPDMLGRDDAWHDELVSVTDAKITSAKLVGEDGRVLQEWSAEDFESAGSGESGDTGPQPPFEASTDRYTMAYYTLLSDDGPDVEELAANSPEAQDINEFEKAEMIDRVAERLSGVPMPTEAYTLRAREAVGKYDLDREVFLLGEEHSDTNWRALFSSVETMADGNQVLVTPVESFDPASVAMSPQEAREKLEKADLLNDKPYNRHADIRAVLRPVSVTEDGKVERPWAKHETGGIQIDDGVWEGPVMRVRIEKMEFSENPPMGERTELFTWTPESS